MNPTIIFKKLHPDAKIPRYQSAQASGMDLHSVQNFILTLQGEVAVISTGVSVQIPEGYEAQIRPRSGLASKGIVGILGTIDADYRGELKVILVSHSMAAFEISAGDRIAQLVIAPVAHCEIREGELSETIRGAGGLGSTGL